MYKKATLSNGLRVITHDMKDRESIGLGFLVGGGGRYESDKIKGAAHFLEHILFKGSKKYSCNAIKEQIEGVGGSLNAFTSEEVTCYYAKFPSKHLTRTFDILSDMVFHPLISAKDVKKESTVIIEEIKMYYDLPQFFVIELLDSLVWPDHPLGKNLAGSAESVARITNKDLKGFHREYYSPNNIVVSVCGDLTHKRVVDLIKKKAGKISGNKQKGFKGADNSQSKPKASFKHKDIEQMHLALGMIGLPNNHDDRYILSLVNVILGGNMSSRLFNEVREKRGLAYSISSSARSLKDTGLFLIRAGVDNKKISEAVDVILKELDKMGKKGVSKDELKRAKEFLLGQVLLSLEDTLDHMLWLGDDMISRNRTRTLKEVINKVNKIDLADIRRVANGIFKRNRLNLAIVGPVNDAQENELCSLMKL